MSAFTGINFKELRKELENDPLWKELDSVRKINEKLRECVEFYARTNNGYKTVVWKMDCRGNGTAIYNGEMAQKTLKQLKQ